MKYFIKLHPARWEEVDERKYNKFKAMLITLLLNDKDKTEEQKQDFYNAHIREEVA